MVVWCSPCERIDSPQRGLPYPPSHAQRRTAHGKTLGEGRARVFGNVWVSTYDGGVTPRLFYKRWRFFRVEQSLIAIAHESKGMARRSKQTYREREPNNITTTSRGQHVWIAILKRVTPIK